MRLLAKGSADQNFGPPPGGVQQKAGPAKQEWKLTHVKFSQQMTSNTKANTKKATFYGSNSGVEVFHFPTLNIDDNMDPDRPKKDSIHLRCDVLEVEGKQAGERTTQTMIAKSSAIIIRDDAFAEPTYHVLGDISLGPYLVGELLAAAQSA